MTEPTHPPDRLSTRVTHPTPTAAVLHVGGELDLFTAPVVDSYIARQLTDKPTTHLVLDLTEITFFGSAGVATLVRASESAAEHDVMLILAAASRVVLRPLQVTGIASLLTIRESLEAAIAACA
ncbi:STAS domain-containing protein [Actinophytocola sp.]|uniref:STAS domain-containing protein n=1 Tax=Actinophytocola sp. TaxID=1872138 RepID=UPI002D7F9CF4|nr:STAS domain-containing protein [Actinophytocola sp.]HET9143277.1 STAS domain-containing protein [Actinophytocola sp.]